MKKVSRFIFSIVILAVFILALKLSAAELSGECSQPLYCRDVNLCSMNYWHKDYLDGSVDCCGSYLYQEQGAKCKYTATSNPE